MTGPRPEELRDNPIAIANFLTRALRTNDLELVVAALGSVIRAQNVLAVAEAAGLRREGLYRTFSGDGDPRIGRLLKLFAALDVQLVVRALPQTPKPARPKLGPPFRTKPDLKAKR
jgi:probable addiction module antidote protein